MAQLNEEQKKAVLQMDNAVVAAGAGSGKTFVLAQRYSHLVLEKGFTVDQILTLTFTNKAAEEMRSRTASLMGLPEKDFKGRVRDGKVLEVSIKIFDEDCSSRNMCTYLNLHCTFSLKLRLDLLQ